MSIQEKLELIKDQKDQLADVIRGFGASVGPFTTYAQSISAEAANIRESIEDIDQRLSDGAILQMGEFVDVLSAALSQIAAAELTQTGVQDFVSRLKSSISATSNDNARRVILWGDSLTNPDTYSNELQRLIENGGNSHVVVNCGVGWNKSYEVAQRMGALLLNVKTPFEIPANTDFVPIEFENYGGLLSIDLYSANKAQKGAFNPVEINGVEGQLSCISVDNGHITLGGYAFSRSEPGTALSVQYGAEMTTFGSKAYNSPGDVAVIFVGTNDGAANVDSIMEYIDLMIKHLKSDKYIIIGLESVQIEHSQFLEAVSKEARRYGKHFLNLYQLMREHAVQFFVENGGVLTPEIEEANQIYIDQGRIPACIYRDSTNTPPFDKTHFNEIGYKMMAKLVYDKGKALGYWM